MKRILLLISLSLLLVAGDVCGKVRLPNFISDGMVLQRGMPIKIWGRADAGEPVTVEMGGKKAVSRAGGDGKWEVSLPAMKAGGPHKMKVNDITLNDILIGDVWLCSGQSNMELPVRRVTDMFADEVVSYENPNIRELRVPRVNDFNTPRDEMGQCEWKPLDKENVMEFSALGYFFAKRLYETTKVPVGIFNCSVGGSAVEEWMSAESLEPFPAIHNALGIIRSDEYMASAAKTEQLRQKLWRETLDAADEGLKGDWKNPATDDGDWTETGLFDTGWQRDKRYQPVNGSVWFRNRFTADGLDTGKDATLRLGCIVDADHVYVNGKFVGTTAYQYPPRIYNIPAGVLKEGENVITIRLISNSGAPGFVEDKPYKIVQGGNELGLTEGWKYKRGAVMPASSGSPYNGGHITGFYNGMLHPLFGYGLKGAIWYQGETNTGRAWQYSQLLSGMIDLWRDGFAQPELPFFIVQLPLFLREAVWPSEGGWAELREAQAEVAAQKPNTALVVAIDAGEWNDIHPLDKKTIGDRVALAARGLAFGEKIVYKSPVYESSEIKDGRIVVSFAKDGGKLEQNKELKGFAIAGEDKKFVWADAWTEGDKVVVKSDRVAEPKYVRYGWADNPGAISLRNTDGLPASPFRTDKPVN